MNGRRTSGISRPGGDVWLAALLLAAVAIPAACVLWFMSEAAATQSAAARQSVLDAYRDQLRLMRGRLAADWQARISALDALHAASPADEIKATQAATGADALLLLGARGATAVPPGDDLVSAYVAAEGARPGLQGLRPTRLSDVWQISAPGGRAIALYREATVHMAIHRIMDEHQSAAVRFAVFKPDEGAYDDAVAIGPAMPGWHASFTLLDTAILDGPARARVAAYIWIAAIAIGILGLVALGIGHQIRRRTRLARLKTDLVSAVSHELRTPLSSMRLLVDGLRRDDPLDLPKTREYLDLMAVENARLSRLIDNFLTFARLERRLQLSFTTTDPAQVVEAAVAAMRERLHPGTALEVTIDAGLPAIDADADALVTALLNLLDNAYKYTPPDKQIAVRAAREDGFVTFAVQDNGLGIPAAEHSRIFRRFYRIDRRLSRGTGGVGLGLAIVDEIARAHGGSVSVQSGTGTGSTFIVRLPQATGAAA